MQHPKTVPSYEPELEIDRSLHHINTHHLLVFTALVCSHPLCEEFIRSIMSLIFYCDKMRGVMDAWAAYER
jgi:hypothetical protein